MVFDILNILECFAPIKMIHLVACILNPSYFTYASLAGAPLYRSGTNTRRLLLEKSWAVLTMLVLNPHHSWIIITVCFALFGVK